jgi:predicted enzyme related to lactoylglutathione lyase
MGTVGWHDLSVAPEHTAAIRDFYCAVVGWQVEPVDMGGYSDYVLTDANGVPAAGVCHRRGTNAVFPGQWISYVHVADLGRCVATAQERGGRVIVEPRAAGQGQVAVIEDPSGAVLGLYQG